MSTPNWHKSSYSGGAANDCVEVADNQPFVMVRDTKDHSKGTLRVSNPNWGAFVGFVTRHAACRTRLRRSRCGTCGPRGSGRPR
ncbi:DUF397 domain-containing protein [Streptomyces sp. O3]